MEGRGISSPDTDGLHSVSATSPQTLDRDSFSAAYRSAHFRAIWVGRKTGIFGYEVGVPNQPGLNPDFRHLHKVLVGLGATES